MSGSSLGSPEGCGKVKVAYSGNKLSIAYSNSYCCAHASAEYLCYVTLATVNFEHEGPVSATTADGSADRNLPVWIEEAILTVVGSKLARHCPKK